MYCFFKAVCGGNRVLSLLNGKCDFQNRIQNPDKYMSGISERNVSLKKINNINIEYHLFVILCIFFILDFYLWDFKVDCIFAKIQVFAITVC